ncbi:MAG: hypothetical protein AAGL66_19855 [Pseudomonadota bacterium]
MSKAMQNVGKLVFYVVAVFYGYGALVHILNIAGLSGFNWVNAPMKWQVLDLVYLALDMTVCIGFLARWGVSLAAFVVAAISQIVLYTILRAWIIDVPAEFAVTPAQESYLTKLVVFHVSSLFFVALSYQVVGRTYFGLKRSAA